MESHRSQFCQYMDEQINAQGKPIVEFLPISGKGRKHVLSSAIDKVQSELAIRHDPQPIVMFVQSITEAKTALKMFHDEIDSSKFVRVLNDTADDFAECLTTVTKVHNEVDMPFNQKTIRVLITTEDTAIGLNLFSMCKVVITYRPSNWQALL